MTGRLLFLTTLALLLTLVAAAPEGVDPGADFQGYMEERDKQAEAREKHDALLSEHEIWRQTTYAGWGVRQLQALGNHFSPFFLALADIVQGEPDDTPIAFLLTLVLRVIVISAYIVAAFAIASIVNSVFGQEIVMEEQVIVEVDDDEDEQVEEEEDKKEQ